MCIMESRYFIFFLFIHLPSAFCQRRIVGGQTTNVDATFMVYLLRAEPSTRDYKHWSCGGAIVDRHFVLTSASCLEDVQYMYVIAGYDKFVSVDRMKEDACIMNTRKKIVSWCRQENYTVDQVTGESHLWMIHNVALARVSEPFDFTDPKYLQYCSYQPSIISVGVGDAHGRTPGASALVYGWGHRRYFKSNRNRDTNSEKLRYASVRVVPKEECYNAFVKCKVLRATILANEHICTSGPGFIDDEGHITNIAKVPNINCKNDLCTQTYHETRTQGFCQNDHGGPLVMWIGSERFVVGIATAVNTMRPLLKCISPFLYTPTSCVNEFLMCMLSRTRRTDSCAQENNMVIVDNHLSSTQVTEATNTETVNTEHTERQGTKRSSTEELYWLYD